FRAAAGREAGAPDRRGDRQHGARQEGVSHPVRPRPAAGGAERRPRIPLGGAASNLRRTKTRRRKEKGYEGRRRNEGEGVEAGSETRDGGGHDGGRDQARRRERGRQEEDAAGDAIGTVSEGVAELVRIPLRRLNGKRVTGNGARVTRNR